MRKPIIGTLLALTSLLAACTAPLGQDSGRPSTPPTQSPPPTAFQTGRIISGADTLNLVLAGADGTDDVYLIPAASLNLPATGPGALENGMMVQVGYTGGVLETYPMQLGGVVSLTVLDAPKRDLAGLYLRVLEDLWTVDSGLNDGITQLGVDLSGLEDLTDSEKAALAYVFGQNHDLVPILGTWEALRDQGYFSVALSGEDGRPDLYQWEEGCLFTLNGNTNAFTAEKWRTPLGAYFFSDCTAAERDGAWTYTVGAEVIA